METSVGFIRIKTSHAGLPHLGHTEIPFVHHKMGLALLELFGFLLPPGGAPAQPCTVWSRWGPGCSEVWWDESFKCTHTYLAWLGISEGSYVPEAENSWKQISGHSSVENVYVHQTFTA